MKDRFFLLAAVVMLLAMVVMLGACGGGGGGTAYVPPAPPPPAVQPEPTNPPAPAPIHPLLLEEFPNARSIVVDGRPYNYVIRPGVPETFDPASIARGYQRGIGLYSKWKPVTDEATALLVFVVMPVETGSWRHSGFRLDADEMRVDLAAYRARYPAACDAKDCYAGGLYGDTELVGRIWFVWDRAVDVIEHEALHRLGMFNGANSVCPPCEPACGATLFYAVLDHGVSCDPFRAIRATAQVVHLAAK